MSQAEFTDEYAFVEEAHTRLIEINNFVKILKAVVFQDDDVYYLQDFVELILQNNTSCPIFWRKRSQNLFFRC